MKNFYRALSSVGLLFALTLGFTSQTQAQGYVILDWGGATNVTGAYDVQISPYGHWYTQTRHQYLLTPQDFIAIGMTPNGPVTFTSLGFYLVTLNGTYYDIDNFYIKMKNTSVTSLAGFDNTSLVALYGPKPQLRSSAVLDAWRQHDFDQPFIWDGVSNILVDVCHEQNINYQYGYTWGVRYGIPTTNQNRTSYNYSDGSMGVMCGTPTGYGYTAVPNMRFGCGGNSSIADFSVPGIFQTSSGVIPINYSIGHPLKDFVGGITFNVFTPNGTFLFSEYEGPINCTAGNVVNGVHYLNASTLAPGFYRIEADFDVLNSCGFLDDVFISKSTMALGPGQTACEVWPGDANNDGVVNYGDRKSLNQYIHDANLSALWLTGPARYKTDYATNPLTYFTWELQASVPWNDPNGVGCYHDCDGNGVINSFDFFPIKTNWMKTHGSSLKSSDAFTPSTFDMDQNYPNPFNPTTSIRYSVPEASQVRLIVSDMLGRTVATLVDAKVEAGVHTVQFDASSFSSGGYVATVTMAGIESGLTFNKTIKMTLNK